MPTPRDILADDHKAGLAHVQAVGLERTRATLKRAAADLERRLLAAEGPHGPGTDSFTAVRLRTTLLQVRQVLAKVTGEMRSTLLDSTSIAAEKSTTSLVKYMNAAQKKFSGVGQPLPLREASMIDVAARGAQASVLRRLATSGENVPGAETDVHPGKRGILERYGIETVGHFEEILQQGLITGAPWADVRQQLVDKSPFLQGAPAHWAERIIRTETAGIYNRAGWESIREADEQLGDMLKILSATFDDRTSSDSYAVHGQIRRPNEAFQSWFGLYQHPPNRPNDREVVVPHRKAWPIPDYLAWRSDDEIEARWKEERRKGPPPKRPKMTTVPIDEIGAGGPAPSGKDAAKRESVQVPDQIAPAPAPEPVLPVAPKIPEERFAFIPMPPPPRVPMLVPREPPPIPDEAWLAKRRADAEALLEAERERIGNADHEQLEASAYKALGKKRKSGQCTLPFKRNEISEGVDGYTVSRLRFDIADQGSLSSNLNKLREASKVEAIYLADYVPSDQSGYDHSVRRAIDELRVGRGHFKQTHGDEDPHEPLLMRIGTKLYPINSTANETMAAPRALGMKAVHARVVDGNAAILKVNEKDLERFRPLNEKRKEAQVIRDAEHAAIVKKTTAEMRARVEREHEGDPELVAIRVKHQPAEYAKGFEAKYGEAAASVGWGKAMLERGLDFPYEHVKDITGYLAESFPAEYKGLHDYVTSNESVMKGPGGALRRLLGLSEVVGPNAAANVKGAAAIVGHLDAIRPHDAIPLGKIPDELKAAGVEKKFKLMAAFTDRSVTLPGRVDLLNEDDRAYCSSRDLTGWRENVVRIGLRKRGDTSTVMHEMGHAIDASDRGRGRRASAFLDARTAGDEAKSLAELNPGHRYRPDEVSRKDAFTNSYVGKDYGREDNASTNRYADPYYGEKDAAKGVAETKRAHVSTEVTSMAVEDLAGAGTYNGSAGWMGVMRDDKDPDHFLFGLGQLGGY